MLHWKKDLSWLSSAGQLDHLVLLKPFFIDGFFKNLRWLHSVDLDSYFGSELFSTIAGSKGYVRICRDAWRMDFTEKLVKIVTLNWSSVVQAFLNLSGARKYFSWLIWVDIELYMSNLFLSKRSISFRESDKSMSSFSCLRSKGKGDSYVDKKAFDFLWILFICKLKFIIPRKVARVKVYIS